MPLLTLTETIRAANQAEQEGDLEKAAQLSVIATAKATTMTASSLRDVVDRLDQLIERVNLVETAVGVASTPKHLLPSA